MHRILMPGGDDNPIKTPVGPGARTFGRVGTHGGLTTHEAYFLCVRRFPEAMRVG